MNKRNGKKLAELAPFQDPQDRAAIAATPPEHVEIRELRLWRVVACECNGSNGGPVSFYVLKDGSLEPPACREAHLSLGPGSHELYDLESVTKLAEYSNEQEYFYGVDRCANQTGGPIPLYGCANQTGRPIPRDVAALIASLMLAREGDHKEIAEGLADLRVAEAELRRLRGEEAGGSSIRPGPGHVDCPEPGCDFEYMHPVAVIVNRGGEITTVDHGGTRIDQGTADGRGVSIRVRFMCENGHHTSVLTLHFHKGGTGVSFESIPEDGDGGPPPTIWRD